MVIPGAVGAQQPRGRRQERKQQTRISDLETPVATFRGTLKSIDKKDVILTLTEKDQEVTFHRSRKTKFLKDGKEIKPATITPGTTVSVEAKRDALGNIDAVNVIVEAQPKS